jgi:hypothetical protein
VRVRPAVRSTTCWAPNPAPLRKRAKTTGDLVKLISKKTGLPEQTAETQLEVVLGYLKKNLPEPLGGVVDMLLSGAGTAGGGAGMEDLLGGILGQ